jgi:lipoprotein-anchoring transpeptidase ErfK/SrfK
VAAALAVAIALSGCGERAAGPAAPSSRLDRAARTVNRAGFPQLAPGTPARSAYDPSVIKLQVLLDRARFSPGVIDGRDSDNLHHALRAYAAANGMKSDGTLTKALWNRLIMADPRVAVRTYVIDADDVAGPFTPDLPTDFPALARLERLDWRSRAEQLAEAFHMDPALLQALNPGADFRPGSTVLVADRGGDDLETLAARVEADSAGAQVRVYSDTGGLLAAYPASVGGPRCPPPVGELRVRQIAAQPTYAYDSDSLAVAGASRGRTEVAAGPNNPIGVVWIDLSKDGYGLHGAPEPAQIGKRATHGCVALTNWDARELARAVAPGTPVVFK